jgi:hypothetical protein
MKRQLKLGLKEAFEGILGFIIVNFLLSGIFPTHSLNSQMATALISVVGIFTMPSVTFFYMIGWCGWAYLLLDGGLLGIVDIASILASWLMWAYINVIKG